MKLSLNDVAPVVKWDLQLEMDGVEYTIRPWELRDSQMASNAELSQEENYKWIETLFVGEPPAVREWDEERATKFLGIVLGYKNAIAEKKTQLVAQQVQRMARRG